MENAFHKQTNKQHPKRNSSIELLRIFAGMAVVVLHFNFFKMHAAEVTTGITQQTLLLLEAMCVCAVNVFIAISGYCSVNSRKINLSRLINLILQTSAFRFAFVLMACIVHDSFFIKRLLGSLLPVNYYVILYVSLMFVAPFINILMDKLDRTSLNKFILIAFTIFSVYPTAVDVLEECTGGKLGGLSSVSWIGSIQGYSIVNFTLVYIIGAYIRKIEFINRYKKTTIIISIFVTITLIYIWHALLPDTAYNYSNPLVIIEAILILMFFAKNDFSNNIINFIAPASFTCFLIHNNIFDYLKKIVVIEDSFVFVIGLLCACVLGMYLLSILIMRVWNVLYTLTIAKLANGLSPIIIRER